MDELPEFHRASLEILRQPLEMHKICISRIYGNYEFPADFLLVGAMNERCFVSIQVNDRVRVKVA